MSNRIKTCSFVLLLLMCCSVTASAQSDFRVIGYFSGPTEQLNKINPSKLSHLIFCFGHIRNGNFEIGNAGDSATIQQMVLLKKQNPKLKVLLSLGGWGGCEPCSDAFSTPQGRERFVQSVAEVTRCFHTDGLDLDWEYPAIPGYPGHRYSAQDRENFSALVHAIRRYNKAPFELSFAAGGFTTYIESSIDWSAVVPSVDFINLMTYDLVHGYSRISGHHTPLYSTPQQTESTDHAVQLLISRGVPASKLIIGAAFYGRFFQIDSGYPTQLYQPCRFLHGFSWKHQLDSLASTNGFVACWDSVAQAPYAINEKRHLIATYDNPQSLQLKTAYAKKWKLGGIMFWQLMDDTDDGVLLESIVREAGRP